MKNETKPTQEEKALSPAELMIGNIVLDSTRNTTVVETIIPEHNRVYYGKVLTEDWLLQYGFESHPHFTVMNSKFIKLGRNRQISIGCVGTPNEMVCLQELDVDKRTINDFICLRNFDYDGKTYVHHIQNICALFGLKLRQKGGDENG